MATRGRPARLSRDRIVEAAADVVRAEGIAALSMRRVARHLRSSPMALYRHVADKDALLALLLDHIADSLPRPPPAADPRRTIRRVATITHDWLVANPWAIDVLPAHRMGWSVPWIVDDVLAAFRAAGLSPAGSARAYEVVWHHLLGELTARHSRQATAQPPDGPPAAVVARHATLGELAEHVAAARAHDQYLHGLQALLDGLLRNV